MDTVKDERGQALVLAVLILAISAVAISGLRVAQEQILAAAREHRAGEAAVEAATAVIADAYTSELRRFASSSATPRPPRPTLDVLRAITQPSVRESARAAATEVSLLNGGSPIGDASVRCAAGLIDVSLTISGRLYRAGFSGPMCSPR